jgi:hypothetical protein
LLIYKKDVILMNKNNLKFLIVVICFIAIIFSTGAMADGPMCYLGDGTNTTYCEGLDPGDATACEWDADCGWDAVGCCFTDNAFDDFGSEGCWSNDQDQSSCEANNLCSWSANDKNQNPWCWNEVGCCEQKGCWSFEGDQSSCEGAFGGGLCRFHGEDPWCPNCCSPLSCPEIDDVNICGNMSSVGAPCVWSEGACDFPGNGGFDMFDGSGACMDANGWWDPEANAGAGACNMPDSGMGGGFFGESAHCWFANNKADICGNVSGCAYCVAGSGPNGVDNSTDGDTNGFADNICSGKTIGWCEGHATEDLSGDYKNVNNTMNLNCVDIGLQNACNCGPVGNCIWTNSSATTGNFCEEGSKTDNQIQMCQPPVPFCEHPDALTNYSMCMLISSNYMLPCSWDNDTDQCGFNGMAIFGDDGGDMDYTEIGSDTSCTAAGGTWNSEYYLDGAVLKEESWCDKGAMFSFVSGGSSANKGNCDTDCWACEFDSTGTTWGSDVLADNACTNSSLGYCRWTDDSTASNGLGWCDYPDEFSFGSFATCDADCGACDFMTGPEAACAGSSMNCQWINDSNNPNTGYCLAGDKKTCNSDCFSCYDSTACAGSDLSCAWDDNTALCKPAGFTGEVCFDGLDNDGDNNIDCGDSDCSFDNFCGGNFMADCFIHNNKSGCNNSIAFEVEGAEINCTWVNFTWDPVGHCDMPGSNCWQFMDDSTACDATAGCNSISVQGDGFCEVNFSLVNVCMGLEEGACGTSTNCSWITPEFGGGYCDFFVFDQCHSLAEGACGTNDNCTWKSWYGDENGFCEPVCFSEELNTEELCEANNFCELRGTMCEPEHFGFMGTATSASSGGGGGFGKTGCPRYDGNSSACDESPSCVWDNDTNVDNDVVGGAYDGWCMEAGMSQMFSDMVGAPVHLAMDDVDAAVPNYIDLLELGIRDLDTSYTFGLVFDELAMNNTAMCLGYNLPSYETGMGGNTSKYYWYLDTDGTETGGCCANSTISGGEFCGFEFNFAYSIENTTAGIIETKTTYKCVSEEWISTNIYFSPNRQKGCESNLALIGVEKEALEAFKDLYDKTEPMRILGTVANATYGRSNPQDSVGPAYYTPGTVDFDFVDCSNPNVKDPKCKNFQKFGFNLYEDCHAAGDEDLDGYLECDDPDCINSPICGGNFGFAVDEDDKKTPVMTFTQVDKMHDAGFIKFDTDEPANGSVEFYKEDSECAILNSTLNDLGDPSFDFDDYKPFHYVPLEEDLLGFPLENGTVYYYKTKVCDPSGNCGSSACQNFTTKSTVEYKDVIISMDIPDGYAVDIPDLNVENFTFETTLGGVTYPVGIKTNTSVTKGMNMTFHCGDMDLTFVGVDILKPKKINLSTSFICDEASQTLGMNSSSKAWNNLIYSLGLGGYSDNIVLTFPLAYSASNTIDWCNDGAASCSDVDDYVSCGEGDESGTTDCKIPTSMGFSTYVVSTPAAASSGGGGGSSSYGGGNGLSVEGTEEEIGADEVVADVGDDSLNAEESDEGAFESFTNFKWWAIGAASLIVFLVLILLGYNLYRRNH